MFFIHFPTWVNKLFKIKENLYVPEDTILTLNKNKEFNKIIIGKNAKINLNGYRFSSNVLNLEPNSEISHISYIKNNQ